MTVAIYEKTPEGMYRWGTFRTRARSIRDISLQFCRQYPGADPAKLYMAMRSRTMGVWCDGERIPFDAQ